MRNCVSSVRMASCGICQAENNSAPCDPKGLLDVEFHQAILINVKLTPMLLCKLRKVDPVAVLAFCLNAASQLDTNVSRERLSSGLAWGHLAPAEGVADEQQAWRQLDLLSSAARGALVLVRAF